MADKPGVTTHGKKEWDEQLALEFRLHTKHSKTARYRAAFGEKAFDLYIPLFMLEDAGKPKPPEVLQVALDPSKRSLRTIGFGGTWRTLTPEPGVCEFEVAEQMVNSVKYQMNQGSHTFSIYIPHEVFRGAANPSRVFLRVFSQ